MSIPNEVILTADSLIRDNKWNAVFQGTSFKLGSFSCLPLSTQCPTYEFTKLRWLSYEDGFYWTVRANPKATLYGSDSKGLEKDSKKNYITFGSGETPDIYASYVDKCDNYVMSNFELNQADPICEFRVERRGLYNYCGVTYLVLDMPIIPPRDDMVTALIQYGSKLPPGPKVFTSKCLYTVFIEILFPGPLLEAATCQTSSSLSLNLCRKYCSTGNQGCVNIQSEYCNGEGINTDYCANICKQVPTLDCTVGLERYCEASLARYGNNISTLLAREADRCSCFLPETFWSNYANSLNSYFKINTTPNNVWCYFPLCSQRNVIQRHSTKNLLSSCPPTAGCIKSVDVNSFGEITGPVKTSSAIECIQFNGIIQFEEGTSPKPITPQNVNKINPILTKIGKSHSGATSAIVFSFIGAIVLTAALIAALNVKKRLKK